VLILNDHDTGYPFAVLESSIISATRTAESAALAADRLSRGRIRPTRVGFIGTGLIARYIHAFLAVDHVGRGQQDLRREVAQRHVQHQRVVGEPAHLVHVRPGGDGGEHDQVAAADQRLGGAVHGRTRALQLAAETRGTVRRKVVCTPISSNAHPVPTSSTASKADTSPHLVE
jgi:hypothetical protein